MPVLHQMLGNLFYRGQQINVLNDATFSELKYWNDWHEIISEKVEETTKQIESELNG